MKKIILSILITLSVFKLFAQDQKAVTESGKKVILHSNGNWEYIKENNCSNFSLAGYNAAKQRIARGGDFNFYFNKAWQYVRTYGENNYDAIANFEQAIIMYPTNGGTYSDLGNCYRGGFKCYEKAEFYYTKAIENGFAKGFVYYNRAICKYELNKIDEMRADLEMSKKFGWNNDYYKLSYK